MHFHFEFIWHNMNWTADAVRIMMYSVIKIEQNSIKVKL